MALILVYKCVKGFLCPEGEHKEQTQDEFQLYLAKMIGSGKRMQEENQMRKIAAFSMRRDYCFFLLFLFLYYLGA